MSINKRILYVDDNQDSCEMISVLLSILGYEVVQAYTSAEALEKAKNDGFDLCMLDNWLPDGSGIELCRMIRSIKPQTPIIFYSAAVQESDKEAALSAGALAYLAKPTDIEVIGNVISQLVDGDGVKHDGPHSAAQRRRVGLDYLKEARQRWIESSRRRIERSRELANEARERIRLADIKIDQTLSKHRQGKR